MVNVNHVTTGARTESVAVSHQVSRLLFLVSFCVGPSPLLPIGPPISFLDSAIHPNVYVQTNGHLIPDEVVSRIEEITAAQEDGAKLADHLSEDAVQVCIDIVYEVCPHTLLLLGCPPVLFLKFPPPGFRSFRSPFTSEEVVECFMLCMRPSGFASEVSPDLALL